MKVVILAGGLGTRLAEETEIRPKPMVEIGGRPILWHIMQLYSYYNFNEFYIALGYKGEVIKRYFLDYYSLSSDISINLQHGKVEVLNANSEHWKVHLVDTGQATMTGGRIKRLEPYLNDDTFMVTYGDGVCDVNLASLLRFHKTHGLVGTVTAVRPPARFGGLELDGDKVKTFIEKPQVGEGWINGGFQVYEPRIFDYLADDTTILEAQALEQLSRDGQLAAYRHENFWQCMDTLRDKRILEDLWQSNNPPWKVWD